MFHYHYIKVIADSENMSTEEITSVLQKILCKTERWFLPRNRLG